MAVATTVPSQRAQQSLSCWALTYSETDTLSLPARAIRVPSDVLLRASLFRLLLLKLKPGKQHAPSAPNSVHRRAGVTF